MKYDYYMDVDEQSWEEYLSHCRANNVLPKMDSYTIWLGDSDQDEPEWGDVSNA